MNSLIQSKFRDSSERQQIRAKLDAWKRRNAPENKSVGLPHLVPSREVVRSIYELRVWR